MPRLLLTVIPKPKPLARTVIEGRVPFFTGKGDYDLSCGACGVTLAGGVVNGQIRMVVFRCPECNSYCEQISPPAYSVPQGRIIELARGDYRFGATIRCPPYIMIAGEAQ